jgi:molecular chaperone Hsp33
VNDYLVRIMTTSGNVRGLACITTNLVRELCQRHDTWPTASVALGRALTGGALMGATLKDDQRLALKFEGNGPLRKIMVEVDADGAVRGAIGRSDVDLPPVNGREDIPGALGRAGFLTVTKDLGLKQPYQGVVQLATSEIGEDLAHYLTESEQIPSAVGLGVATGPEGVLAAGGFLLQVLPPQDDAVIDQLMARIDQLPALSELLKNGATPEDLLERLFAGIPYEQLEIRPLHFQCSCSRAKVERVLISLGPKELGEMVLNPEGTAVACEFCTEKYHYSPQELQNLLCEVSGTI